MTFYNKTPSEGKLPDGVGSAGALHPQIAIDGSRLTTGGRLLARFLSGSPEFLNRAAELANIGPPDDDILTFEPIRNPTNRVIAKLAVTTNSAPDGVGNRHAAAGNRQLIRNSTRKENDVKREDLFPSTYVKHADLNGSEFTVTIERLAIEEVGMDKERKPVLIFKDAQKRLICNRTNYESIADVYGEETDLWPGKQITLYGDRASFGGKIVDCVRVKAPNQTATAEVVPLEGAAEAKPAEQDTGDSIPF